MTTTSNTTKELTNQLDLAISQEERLLIKEAIIKEAEELRENYYDIAHEFTNFYVKISYKQDMFTKAITTEQFCISYENINDALDTYKADNISCLSTREVHAVINYWNDSYGRKEHYLVVELTSVNNLKSDEFPEL